MNKKKTVNKGKFIVIEGLDGSGSTTQVGLTINYLSKLGFKAFATKEPTDNVIGGLIRGALTGVYKLPSSSLQLLFSADRGHHVDRMVKPIVSNGGIVVSDRYYWSTIAFGSVDLDREWLLNMQKYFLTPDLTVLLKVPPAECVRRMSLSRYDLELYEEKEKLSKVWKTYIWLAKKFSKSVVIIDGVGSVEEVNGKIIAHINKLLDIGNHNAKEK